MVSEQLTRKVQKELRETGFQPVRTSAVPDGHKTISPGVYRKIMKAMKEAQ